MKVIKSIAARNILLMGTALLMLFYFSSCAKKISFQTSTVVPAAKGAVKVTKDNNSNYKIKIAVENLAEPKRLQPSRNTYVVWMRTADNGTKNLGQINTSSGFLSSKLKANFETVSSFKPIQIFVTAEDDASIQYPGMQVVLSTDSF